MSSAYNLKCDISVTPAEVDYYAIRIALILHRAEVIDHSRPQPFLILKSSKYEVPLKNFGNEFPTHVDLQ